MQMQNSSPAAAAIIMAGIPEIHPTLYHRLQFSVGDPAVLIELPADAGGERILILRDIEMERARAHARADRIACPADYPPEGGLSGDRETATAQAAAECLRRAGFHRAVADRALPLIYADHLRRAGIEVECDLALGVLDRRAKSLEEVGHLREAQQATEGAIRLACEMVAGATANRDGLLELRGAPLTSERVRAAVDVWLLERGYTSPPSIIAGGPVGADCHAVGSGNLRTGQPVIIDIFPRNRESRYHGDCTRTVVHGDVPDEIARMYEAVVEAKHIGMERVRAGATGEEVHRATIETIRSRGFEIGLPGESDPPEYTAMVHGTGHGIGLEVHEPPLLDFGGPALVPGDALTVEPGLYSRALGGVRSEDLVIVTETGCENLNALPDTLTWD